MKCAVAAVVLVLATGTAEAGAQLQYVFGGDQGTVVFIHGKSDCSWGMSGCNGGDSTSGPNAYWTNRSTNYTLVDEATTKLDASGGVHYYEAFTIGYDLENQGFWYAANDVGGCLQDLYQGTNNSGCNPNRYQRTQFHLVAHSAGGTILDRLLSTGWYSINDHVVGNVVVIAPALAGSRAASALYGIDNYGNFCTGLVSWLAGWALKNNGAQSLTRSSVIGEANKGYAGRAPRWLLKVTTTGGSGSANNNWYAGVDEHDNDSAMGALAGCLGWSDQDDMDGLLYWSDSDPTNNTAGNNCPTSDHSCHYYSQFTGSYWHWFESWANHSHSRDDAYNDMQTTSGCYTRTPGGCVGQYGI
ncbi:MAG TPA: hypothetical protein VL463_00190 [Kofleriaceae bacterium]|jgi:hypothetical protein|nr:hypothetical protein [Kofleriaceae bacterium]